jgi:hypothetical protein
LLRGTFGLKREELTGGWRILLNEELHNFHSSPDITAVMKSTRMRWAGHVVCIEEKKMNKRVW